ncbi:MAG TPA: sensor histidine kinase, partial [Prolixibacteraceae bacterium]|nr:sensor histidine kinase [Prolixibacteraceae bacterium]
LTEKELPDNKVIGLNGNVEFYWEQLLTPHDFNNNTTLKPDGMIKIPGIWNHFKQNDKKIGGMGYATYRFKILSDDNEQYAIRIKEFDTAYKMWVNDQYIEAGKVGRSEEEMRPNWKRNEIIFEPDSGEINIIIQISNFLHRKGGPEDRMFFGTAQNIMQYKQRIIITNAFLLGILVILSIYHFILYVYRRQKSTFIFSLLCFFIALRLLTTSEKLIFEIFPDINWLLAIKLEYLSYKIALPLLVAFIHSLYPAYLSKRIINGLFILAALFSLIVLFAPVQIFTYTPLIYQFVLAAGAIYAFIALTKATFKREENAAIILAGYLVFFSLLTNDMLYYNKVINSSFMMHYGLFILAVSQAIVLSKRFSTSHLRAESLSIQLEEHNRQLEDTIHERTKEIQEQKEEIKQQADNLQETNKQLHDLTVFKDNLTQMIVHDLKNPLNVILNVSRNEQVVYAGTQMLNLVQNLLDVQRYENADIKLNKENIFVIETAQQALYQLKYLIKEKSIDINLDIADTHTIYADKEIITRVFINLLSNAIRFSPFKGEIVIHTKKQNDVITTYICDKGPGIPEEEKDLVFKKFGQFISTLNQQKGTTGIGLTFCKMALDTHGGSIDFYTQKEKGTTFFFSLPEGTNKKSLMIEHNNNDFDDFQNNFNEIFDEEEKQLLSDITKKLNKLKTYQIGEIKKVLSETEKTGTPKMKKWLVEVKKAIFNSDKKYYKHLIDMVK